MFQQNLTLYSHHSCPGWQSGPISSLCFPHWPCLLPYSPQLTVLNLLRPFSALHRVLCLCSLSTSGIFPGCLHYCQENQLHIFNLEEHCAQYGSLSLHSDLDPSASNKLGEILWIWIWIMLKASCVKGLVSPLWWQWQVELRRRSWEEGAL